MLANLTSLEYLEMTPIQELSIPPILKRRDILAQAKTGSGKTAAFGIGILERLDVDLYQTQNLTLCPTRELAEQVSGEIRRIARFQPNIKIQCITGGMPMKKQESSLKHPAHIIVGTPGRILKLLERGTLNLEKIKSVILDEADRMLDMGFMDEIHSIFKLIPSRRQTLCFSATFPDEIRDLGRAILKEPAEITVESFHNPEVIDQHFLEVPYQDKTKACVGILGRYNPESTIVFCNTKDVCRKVGEQLNAAGLHSLALHGDLDQGERTRILIRFSNRSSRVLVATDVASRGIDIDSLGAVINYDLPFETETYVHRIGRTGRAGKEGVAFSLMTPKELFRLKAINEHLKSSFEAELPDPELKMSSFEMEPEMITLSINGGRKNKVSPGDLLGALTSEGGVDGSDVGKIDRLDTITYVAVKRSAADRAIRILENGSIKGRRYKVLIHD